MPNFDVSTHIDQIRILAYRNSLNCTLLGLVRDFPLLLLTPKLIDPNLPNLLIATGFHGDEPAGCLAIKEILENELGEFAELTQFANLSFLPIVNPTGIEAGIRTNYLGQDPNRGFYALPGFPNSPSIEGEILLKNQTKLKYLAKDGFLSLHEDVDLSDTFYLYTFESLRAPGPFSYAMQLVAARHFSPPSDGIWEGARVKNGIIYRHSDTSLEDYLFKCGIPLTASAEVPAQNSLDKHVALCTSYIKAFAEYFQTQPSVLM